MGFDRGVSGRGDACGIGGVGHPLRVCSEVRVGQRISASASDGGGGCAISPSFGASGVVVGSDRDARSCTGWLPFLCSRARFLVLPRRREPSLGPRLRGETRLAGGLGWSLYGPHEALPHGARSRGHAPPRPSPEGEGVFVVPPCNFGASRNALPARAGNSILGTYDHIAPRSAAEGLDSREGAKARREDRASALNKLLLFAP